MTVRYLFRGKKLVIVLNKFRHSENYSFIVVLQTAIANQLEKRSSLITNEIVKNSTSPVLIHSAFDQLDQYINDVKCCWVMEPCYKKSKVPIVHQS